MFIKSLTITDGNRNIIRDIQFHLGLNLIVDETPINLATKTGNNVGKTTVLKLIDYCLAGKAKEIYTDSENLQDEYKLVKDFLINNKIVIALVLKDDLNQEDSREVLVERNFLPRNLKILRIDGVNKTIDEFEKTLTDLLFPGHFPKKPTFRQIIAHNIRYKDLSITHTLKNLNPFTSDVEYETLYLFLFGCNYSDGDVKQDLRTQIKIEEKFKKRLETDQTKSGYESALGILRKDIEEIEQKKLLFNLSEDFETDLDELNKIKYQINFSSSEISRLDLRKNLILEAQAELQSSKSSIDLKQLKQIYQQASLLVNGIQKTFEELNNFHNKMIDSKIRFIVNGLPKIDTEIKAKRKRLKILLNKERILSEKILQGNSYEELEKLIIELNEKYRRMGEYENTLQQIMKIENNLAKLNNELKKIDDELFSNEFESKIKEQIGKFNLHFSSVSQKLYGEKYAIKYDVKTSKGRPLYVFSSFNTNLSSGKKQGEISCFDIAYTLFADEESIPCMHFLLNDKKELMHDNQLLNIVTLVNNEGIQFIASILKDKLPMELNKEEYIVLRLSQEDKLFRIEANSID